MNTVKVDQAMGELYPRSRTMCAQCAEPIFDYKIDAVFCVFQRCVDNE